MNRSFIFALASFLVLCLWSADPESRVWATEPAGSLKVAVVGDTGMGPKGFHPGFLAVMQSIAKEKPDVLLHVGDYIYYGCSDQLMETFKKYLVDPFQSSTRIFAPGDNDLETIECWEKFNALSSEPLPNKGNSNYQGYRYQPPASFLVLNSGESENAPLNIDFTQAPSAESPGESTPWLIVALHEPPLTTAWYLDKSQTALPVIQSLHPDLVLSGHQHSYERFHALGDLNGDGTINFNKPQGTPQTYRKGSGRVHIVTGGGGATFKPFADLTGNSSHSAPEWARKAVAKRGLLNHYLILDIMPETLSGKTYRVCPEYDPGKDEPRWRSGSSMWDGIQLDCDGQPPGVTLYDEFRIEK